MLKVQDDILTTGTSIGTVQTDDNGSQMLRGFVESLYDDGARGGDLAVFHLNPDAYLTSTTELVGYVVSHADDIGNEPKLILDVKVRFNATGATYVQDFDDVLAGSPSEVGALLPLGWTANNNGTINSQTTQVFPSPAVAFGTYNAGEGVDRILATGNDDSTGENELQFSASVTGSGDVRAVRLAFGLEAWAGNLNAASPGEAAYLVDLEVDRSGNGDFGRIFAVNDGSYSLPRPARRQ